MSSRAARPGVSEAASETRTTVTRLLARSRGMPRSMRSRRPWTISTAVVLGAKAAQKSPLHDIAPHCGHLSSGHSPGGPPIHAEVRPCRGSVMGPGAAVGRAVGAGEAGGREGAAGGTERARSRAVAAVCHATAQGSAVSPVDQGSPVRGAVGTDEDLGICLVTLTRAAYHSSWSSLDSSAGVHLFRNGSASSSSSSSSDDGMWPPQGP